jgi:hypothetical protein
VASDVSEIVEIPEDVHTSLQKSLPVNTLQLQICVIFLKSKVEGFVEVYVGSFHAMGLMVVRSIELLELKVFRKNFH